MNQVRFKISDHTFFSDVKKGVDEYFLQNQLKKTGNMELYVKAALYLPLAAVLYLFLLLGNYAVITGILLCILLGFTLSMIAINVMHDACHGSFSGKNRINTLMGLTLNALGSNAFLWRLRHNIHHTYTNIQGIDFDIDNWPLFRQSPTQEWRPNHRYQYLYMFPLYAISTLEWVLYSDFVKYFTRKISSTPIQKISFQEHILFWLGKGMSLIFYVILPVWLLGWQYGLIGFLIVHGTMGMFLTTVFQLAHLVGNTQFEIADKELKQIDMDWAVYEVMTTSNFSPDSRVLSWIAGGLNYQIEHHLFPHVSHVHYRAISKIIRKECKNHQLPYNCYPSMGAAIMSHIRFMKALGKKPHANQTTQLAHA